MIKIIVIIALLVAGYLAIRRVLTSRSGSMTVEQARGLLGVESGADASAIIAAHKRLIAKVHPDSGGSAHLAAQVNAARDILLKSLPPAS
jgi:DnaJ homolog subfamily C member 19